MLPTREDAERLAEAIRGQDLLTTLKALQGFELKVEDIPNLETDVAMVIADLGERIRASGLGFSG